jgi:hypothetical protein
MKIYLKSNHGTRGGTQNWRNFALFNHIFRSKLIYQKIFEEFITSTLEIVNEFVVKNRLSLMYRMFNQEQFLYDKAKSPHNDKTEYSIIGSSRQSVRISFTKLEESQYQIFIDNGQISLKMNQDSERLTNYHVNDLNNRIDNIKGNPKERLTQCLYIMWDFACFFVFLSKPIE